MEKKSRIIGMPLVTIKEGAECGNIAQLVVDAGAKRVTHLVVGNGKGMLGINLALPVEKLLGAGRDYITTSEAAGLVPLWTIGEGLGNCLCDSDLIGLRIMSNTGDIIGKVEDFSFDTSKGDILELNMSEGAVIDRARIITIAPKGVFVDYEDSGKQPLSITASPVVAAAPAAQASSPAELSVKKPDAAAAKKAEGEGDDYFVKKQSEYLIGRKAKKDILGPDGATLVTSGTKVTTQIIENVRSAGKLTELMLHVE